MTVLDAILARKRLDVAARKEQRPLEVLKEGLGKSERDFYQALAAPGLGLIAELKRKSPSKGMIREDWDPEGIARIYDTHASAISVLCDTPFFGGGHEILCRVRPSTHLPLLCKDFIEDPYQIYEARAFGADAVLLMASVLSPEKIEEYLGIVRSLGMEALVEVHNEKELEGVLSTSARIVGVNNRDLKTLAVDPENVFRLGAKIKPRLLVAESGFLSSEEVEAVRGFADAALIGTAIMGAPDIEGKIKELGW